MGRNAAWAFLFGISFVASLRAQEFSAVNANIGVGAALPVGPASAIAGPGGHFVLGAGANVSRRFGLNGEFLWMKVPVKKSALQQANLLSASTAEIALTVNSIVRFPASSRIALYGIGGVGWYHRFGSLVLDEPGRVPAVICGSLLAWIGVDCVHVLIPSDQVPRQASSSAFGGNIGAGITRSLGEKTIKLYAETRYHHAAHSGTDSDNVLLTLGVRW
jgi:hypothetical protein